MFYLFVAECGGRFVENDEFCIHEECLRNFKQLFFCRIECGDEFRRLDVYAEAFEKLAGLLYHCALVEDAEFGYLLAHKNVFVHFEVVEDVDFLVNESYARVFRLLHRSVDERFAVKDDFPAVARVDAGKNVHKRGLSRAVFAEESVHLSLLHGKIHFVEHRDAEKRLFDALHFKNVAHNSLFTSSWIRLVVFGGEAPAEAIVCSRGGIVMIILLIVIRLI